jgi:hypothetical protein
MPVFALAGGLLFFGGKLLLRFLHSPHPCGFPQKEKYLKKIRPMLLVSCTSRIYRGLPEGISCPSENVRHPRRILGNFRQNLSYKARHTG